MKFLIDLISEQLAGAFEKAGFDAAYGKATLSNRPDLCEYQCNGALAAAKQYHKAPIQIANVVLDALGENEMFSSGRHAGLFEFKALRGLSGVLSARDGADAALRRTE